MTTPESLVGKQINQFRIDEYIARGSMGMVFKAYDTVLLRPVALKIISYEEVLGVGDEVAMREEACKRLIQEAKAAGRLNHPNVVTIYSYGRSAECHYICMELVSGKTLAEVLREKKRLDVAEAAVIVEQVLLALEAAAGEHIVHRDIKPSNIMIDNDGCVKVMDFGIAKLPSCASTTAGTILGTPYYMSPEQISGQVVDIRSDIFSLGTVLYQTLAGELPFEGDTTATITYKILHVNPVPIQAINDRVPRPMAAILTKALQKDPALRYQTPTEMLEDLRIAVNAENLTTYSQSDATLVTQRRASSLENGPPDTESLHIPADAAISPGEPAEEGVKPHSESLVPKPFRSEPSGEPSLSPSTPSIPRRRRREALRNWVTSHRVATVGLALLVLLMVIATATLFGLPHLGYRLFPGWTPWFASFTGSTSSRTMPGPVGPAPYMAPRIEGHYVVDGVNPNGGRYRGTAVIGKTGDRYVVSWNIANQIFSGYGVLNGSTLTVNWRGTGVSGVVAYTLQPGGTLQGTWADGKGRETLIPSP